MNPTPPEPLELLDAVGRAPVGRRRFIAGAGAVAGASAVGSLLPVGAAEAAVPVGASNFHILPKAVRLADTRSGSWPDLTTIAPNRHIRVQITSRHDIPATATAAVLTVTAINLGPQNYVTVFPSNEQVPTVSTLNMAPGAVTANMATVKVGNIGAIDLLSYASCHLIVDVLGYYEPVAGSVGAGRYVALTPRRAYDSRNQVAGGLVGNGSYTDVDLAAYLPGNAAAAVINLTAARSTARGFFTAAPFDATGVPTTSSLNVSGPGESRASAAIVPVQGSANRKIRIYAERAAVIIVDVFGYYTNEQTSPGEDGLFVPMSPVRIKDTRAPGDLGRMWPNWVAVAKLPAEIEGKAASVAVNVTGAQTRDVGYLTVLAANQVRAFPPSTSNVNWSTAGAVVPNHAISLVTAGSGLEVYNFSGSHVLVDLFGYFTGTPLSPTWAPYQNPPPPAAPPPWILRIPRLGLTSSVIPGSPDVVDHIDPVSGKGYTWHWTGTGYMGQAAHVAAFGHRTNAGGPYRYLDQMIAGDRITITTRDGREYTYQMVRRDLTDAATPNILNATRAHPGTTFSLVACTVGYDRTKSAYPNMWAPTSLKYRIVVTFELVSWREV